MEATGEGREAGSSIADMLRAAAEEVLSASVPPGFTYIDEYGQYYSHESGYYYDPNTCLFYHPETQTYYYYDESEETYKVYKSMKPLEWSKRAYRRKATNLLGDVAVEGMNQEDVDVCESLFCTLDLLEDPEERMERRKRAAEERSIREEQRKKRRHDEAMNKLLNKHKKARHVFDGDELIEIHDADANEKEEEKRIESSDESLSEEDDEDERIRMMKEEGFDQPPCVRLIHSDTQQLFIVTVIGASIGTTAESDVHVIDASLPVRLASIVYEEEKGEGIQTDENDDFRRSQGRYLLKVLSNGAKCVLNGVKIKKSDTSPSILSHGSQLEFTKSNVFHVHIHSGRNTCAACEPGLLLPSASEEVSVGTTRIRKGESARRAEMRRMKKALGLQEEETDSSLSSYTDRANIRRKTVGSERGLKLERRPNLSGGMYDGCTAKPLPGAAPITTATNSKAAANKKISTDNKGFKLLKMMGWKEGQGLGKAEDGRIEPVANEVKNNRGGLGSAPGMGAPLPTTASTMREAILEKTRDRFRLVCGRGNEMLEIKGCFRLKMLRNHNDAFE